MPQTSYVKAIDVWMGVCTAFVFAALVEFTMVNYLWRKNVSPYLRWEKPQQSQKQSGTLFFVPGTAWGTSRTGAGDAPGPRETETRWR